MARTTPAQNPRGCARITRIQTPFSAAKRRHRAGPNPRNRLPSPPFLGNSSACGNVAARGSMNRTETDFAGLLVALNGTAEQVDGTLETLLPKPAGLQSRVQEAMRYAIFAGGKRLRPFLLLQSAALFGLPSERALRAAAAIEAVHTYSLVHDDLPCMDDDDLRRGRPTTHKAFGEATAVLAGDALLTIAFEILSGAETHP